MQKFKTATTMNKHQIGELIKFGEQVRALVLLNPNTSKLEEAVHQDIPESKKCSSSEIISAYWEAFSEAILDEALFTTMEYGISKSLIKSLSFTIYTEMTCTQDYRPSQIAFMHFVIECLQDIYPDINFHKDTKLDTGKLS